MRLHLLETPAATAWLTARGIAYRRLPSTPGLGGAVRDDAATTPTATAPLPAAHVLEVTTPLPRTHALDHELAAARCDWGWWSPSWNFAALRLFVTDMDSTLITVECIDEIAEAVGKKAEVARITEAAMEGKLDFRAALTARVALLKGLPATELDAIVRTVVQYTPGARALVAALKAQGTFCLLVSGGFTHFTAPIAAELGFDAHVANRLEIDAQGRLTGRVLAPIIDAAAKRDALLAARAQLGCDRNAILAAGDGANDRLMLQEAGLRLGYRPKAVLLPELNLVSMTAGLALPLWLCR
nr:phosphoserine phosphatase SerB [Hydrogenophilus thiooxidans]